MLGMNCNRMIRDSILAVKVLRLDVMVCGRGGEPYSKRSGQTKD